MLYQVKTERLSLAKKLTASAIVFAITFFGSILIHRLWFAQSPWALWEKLFDALAIAGALFMLESKQHEYEIEVTDEAISMRDSLRSSAQKVRRGRIHFARESGGNIFREPALRLSEHGPIHRFLFGYVWVPRRMPQYEEIKSKAISWMDIG